MFIKKKKSSSNAKEPAVGETENHKDADSTTPTDSPDAESTDKAEINPVDAPAADAKQPGHSPEKIKHSFLPAKPHFSPGRNKPKPTPEEVASEKDNSQPLFNVAREPGNSNDDEFSVEVNMAVALAKEREKEEEHEEKADPEKQKADDDIDLTEPKNKLMKKFSRNKDKSPKKEVKDDVAAKEIEIDRPASDTDGKDTNETKEDTDGAVDAKVAGAAVAGAAVTGAVIATKKKKDDDYIDIDLSELKDKFVSMFRKGKSVKSAESEPHDVTTNEVEADQSTPIDGKDVTETKSDGVDGTVAGAVVAGAAVAGAVISTNEKAKKKKGVDDIDLSELKNKFMKKFFKKSDDGSTKDSEKTSRTASPGPEAEKEDTRSNVDEATPTEEGASNNREDTKETEQTEKKSTLEVVVHAKATTAEAPVAEGSGEIENDNASTVTEQTEKKSTLEVIVHADKPVSEAATPLRSKYISPAKVDPPQAMGATSEGKAAIPDVEGDKTRGIDKKESHNSGDEISLDDERKNATQSRCGFDDDLHNVLITAGEYVYDACGDPDFGSAKQMLKMMESTEIVLCGCMGTSSPNKEY